MYDRLEEFIKYLSVEAGKSDNTCQSYRRDIRQFFDWLCSSFPDNDLNRITAEQIGAYKEKLEQEKKSPATVSRFVASLKAFFSYCQREGWMTGDPVTQIKAPKVIRKAPLILTDAEVMKLLSQPDPDSPKGIRDRAMLELLSDTGLRVSELTGLKCSDVDLAKRKLNISGGRTRTVTYDRRISRFLESYVRDARDMLLTEKNDCGYLFVNISGEEMSRQGFWKIIKKYGSMAGIQKDLTPHTLRHSFAAHALKNGKSIRDVQKVLGHSDAETTSGYMNLEM